MADETVTFDLKVNPGDAPAQVKKVGDALKDLDGKSGALQRTTEESNRRFQGLINVSRGVAEALAGVSPEAQKAVSAIQSIAGSAIQGAAAFGPWGAAVGGLTAALPHLVTALSDTGTELTETGRAARAMATDFEMALRRVRELDAAVDVQQRRAAGRLTFDEARADVLQAQAREGEARRGFTSAFENDERLSLFVNQRDQDRIFNAAARGDRDEAIRRLTQSTSGRASSVARGTSAIDTLIEAIRGTANAQGAAGAAGDRLAESQAREVMDAVDEVTRRNRERLIQEIEAANRGGGGGGQSAAELQRELERENLAIKREQMEIEEAELGILEKQLEVLARQKSDQDAAAEKRMEDIEALAEKQREVAQQERDDAEQAIDLFRYRWQAQRDAEEDAADRKKKADDEERAMIQGITGLIEEGAEAAFQAFKISEGPQEAIRAGIEVAKAFASYPDPIGIASHTIAAGLHAANAAQMGFSSNASVAPPSAPSNRAASGGSSGGAGTIIVNYNQPTAEALIGRDQAYAQRTWQRRLAA
jgi:hypothetical protein